MIYSFAQILQERRAHPQGVSRKIISIALKKWTMDSISESFSKEIADELRDYLTDDKFLEIVSFDKKYILLSSKTNEGYEARNLILEEFVDKTMNLIQKEVLSMLKSSSINKKIKLKLKDYFLPNGDKIKEERLTLLGRRIIVKLSDYIKGQKGLRKFLK